MPDRDEPHPSAARCITRVAEIMGEAGRKAGLPDGAIGWMTTVTLEGTQELMKAREVSVILATGGMGLVRAAYSAGKPAYGVGPGKPRATSNRARMSARPPTTSSPARRLTAACSARHQTRSSSIRRSKPRPAGNSWIRAATSCRRPRPTRSRSNSSRLNACRIRFRRQSRLRLCPESRHRGAAEHPRAYRRAKRRRPRLPLSFEKLCPVLSYYVVKDWREGSSAARDPALRRHGSHDVDPLAE